MDFISLLLFILPAYIANSTPVLFGGGLSVDFGRSAWGKRIFGDGKTWRGLFAGIAFGTLTGILEAGVLGDRSFILLGILLSVGTMFGDLFGSFVKRRFGVDRGQRTFLIDQLPFLVFALILAAPIRFPGWLEVTVLAVITYFLHIASNFIAHRIGLKNVPW